MGSTYGSMNQSASATPFDNTGVSGTLATKTNVQDALTDINASGTATQLYDHWNGTTQYTQSGVRQFTNTGSTDGNGRITFNVTADGTAGGTALFTSVFAISITGGPSAFNAVNAPSFYVESVSADRKQVVIRGVKGTTLLALGTTITYLGSGVGAYILIIGAR